MGFSGRTERGTTLVGKAGMGSMASMTSAFLDSMRTYVEMELKLLCDTSNLLDVPAT